MNEKACEVVFDADITHNNRIVQTNDNPVGSDNNPRDLIKATFGEEAEGSITTGTFTITNNTVPVPLVPGMRSTTRA